MLAATAGDARGGRRSGAPRPIALAPIAFALALVTPANATDPPAAGSEPRTGMLGRLAIGPTYERTRARWTLPVCGASDTERTFGSLGGNVSAALGYAPVAGLGIAADVGFGLAALDGARGGAISRWHAGAMADWYPTATGPLHFEIGAAAVIERATGLEATAGDSCEHALGAAVGPRGFAGRVGVGYSFRAGQLTTGPVLHVFGARASGDTPTDRLVLDTIGVEAAFVIAWW